MGLLLSPGLLGLLMLLLLMLLPPELIMPFIRSGVQFAELSITTSSTS